MRIRILAGKVPQTALRLLVHTLITLRTRATIYYHKESGRPEDFPHLLFSFFLDRFREFEIIDRVCTIGAPAWNGEAFQTVSSTAAYMIIVDWSPVAGKTGVAVYCDEDLNARIKELGWTWTPPPPKKAKRNRRKKTRRIS